MAAMILLNLEGTSLTVEVSNGIKILKVNNCNVVISVACAVNGIGASAVYRRGGGGGWEKSNDDWEALPSLGGAAFGVVVMVVERPEC